MLGVGFWLVAACLFTGTGVGAADANSFVPAAAPELLEAGTPTFSVIGTELLGLTSPPTDLHELPNGAILVVNRNELAIGDGVRWQVIRPQPGADQEPLHAVAVDRDGSIYAGVNGGFARVVFDHEAQWRFERLPASRALAGIESRSLTRVAVVDDNWYWFGESGPIVAWRPGQEARVLGQTDSVECVFSVGGELYVSDGASGALLRSTERGLERVDTGLASSLDAVVMSTALQSDGSVFAGVGSLGLQRFDGRRFRPVVGGGPLGGRHRISDLCGLGNGLYAAALDNLGIVFFDSSGKIVQMADRSVNHRLARVRRLVRGSGGSVWAAIGDGVACVQFPSRFSDFEAYVTTGLTFSRMHRHEGKLWMQADGRAQRGLYDADGRLVRFEPDSPQAGVFVNALSTAMGPLYAMTERGIFRRTGSGWTLEVAGLVKPHVAVRRPADGRWLYLAVNEAGWLRLVDGRLEAERFPHPGLGEPYVGVSYGSGVYWAELGAGRVARILGTGERPEVRVFGEKDGLPATWVQVFVVDGEVGLNAGGRLFRYERQGDRLVELAAGESPLVGLVGEQGRPARDHAGRLWVTGRETVCVLGDPAAPGRPAPVFLPSTYLPLLFAMEEQGVVWMHQRQRLVRYDPAVPEVGAAPLRTLIGHLQLIDSNRHSYFAEGRLPDLGARDDSIAVQLLSPGAVFRQGVAFEVKLEGGGGGWTSVGAAGVASFTRLKEGHYLLHARARAGEVLGSEVTLEFTVRPPWFRSDGAYLSYGLALVALILAVMFSSSALARRERSRLERLVAERTAELRRSEESFRRLNEELERRVERRTEDLALANDLLRENNRELEAFSYSIAHDLRVPLRNISGFAELLRRRAAAQLDAESNRFLGIVNTETGKLSLLIDALLAFSRISRIELKCTWMDPRAIVDVVLKECAPELEQRTVEWRIGEMPPLYGDPTLIRQVYANLISNAVKFTKERERAIIEVGAQRAEDPAAAPAYYVRDNGIGFDPKYVAKLFGVFERLHTAKQYEGIGIGLANVRRIITHHGGRVWAAGAPGTGATFFFTLPQPKA